MIIPRIALSVAAVGLAGLVLAGSSTAHAQSAPESNNRGLVGEVTEIREDSFTLEQKGTGEIITVSLEGFEAKSNLTIHGAADENEFAEGSQVAVLVDGDQVAKQILVKPSKPSLQAFSGAVASHEEDTMTIVRPDGESLTIQVPSGTPSPETGAVVMGFAHDAHGPGELPVGTGLTTADEMRNRLEGFLQEVSRGKQNRSAEADVQREERIARLSQILADHSARHLAVLEGVLANGNLNEAARAAMDKATTLAQEGLRRAQEAVSQAQASSQQNGERGKPGEVPGRGTP